MTPSRIERLGSPSTRSGLTSRRVPSPEQSGHAPNGELNENWRGSELGERTGRTWGTHSARKRAWTSRRVRPLPSVRGFQRRLDRVGEPRAVGPAHHQPVHHDRDVVVLAAVELRDLREVRRSRRLPGPARTLLLGGLEHVAELALAAAHQRGKTSSFVPSGQAAPDRDLRGGLALDGGAVFGTARCAEPRPQEAQVVVDLGDRPTVERGLWPALFCSIEIAARGPRSRPRRLFHQAEELASVGGERLDVAPLSPPRKSCRTRGRFPRSRQPRDDSQTVARDLDRNVFEVVLAGAANDERIAGTIDF